MHRWPHLGRGRTILRHQRVHISVHNTKDDYQPAAIFQEDKVGEKWRQLLEGRNTDFSLWLAHMEQKGDLRNRLETVFYDEVMIQPLVSELERRKGDPELFHDLMHIATLRTSVFFIDYNPDFCDSEGTRAILVVKNIIPRLCRLPQSDERDELLSKLAEREPRYVSCFSVPHVVAGAPDRALQKDIVEYKRSLMLSDAISHGLLLHQPSIVY